MSRIFKVSGGDVRTARDIGQIDTPAAVMAVLPGDDASIERALARAYELGRKDMRADMRDMLNKP